MTDRTRRRLTLAATASFGLAATGRAGAQAGGYPTKPLKIIVAAPPGGLTDGYARMYAEQFSARFGLPAVVENRPGASGIIATEAMLKAPADGYTILASTTGMVWQTRVMYRKLPFDLAKDVTPITIFPSGALVVAVAERTGVRNFAELVDYAKKTRCAMGSYAQASFPHVFAESVNRDYGGQVQTVQYKGESPMWVEMGSGQIEIAVGSYQAFATVKDKGVRPIAATGMLRSPRLPDVPTLVEQGMKSTIARLEGGIALSANSSVPADILELLAKVAVEGNGSPRAAALRDSYAIPDATKGRADALRAWRDDAAAWIREVEALNVKLD